ncbi:hypothetical protein [Streptomyces pseudogriseolus]|uniref:hypothetical protein n=1 Tax=Streptomyces pseudogriseolus TaxID=36817 RepID=UPI003FA2BE44
MAEPTHTPPAEEDAATPEEPQRRAFGWCAWHEGHAEGVRLIDVIEQGSGSGITHFACGPCRTIYGLTPFADR